MKLQGKIAVVTGGSRGIGFATCKKLASEGATVIITDICDSETAAPAIKELEEMGATAKFYQSNVADFAAATETVNAIVEEFGGIDILVNNAGITRDKLMLKMEESDFDSVISVNLKGTYNMIKATYKQFMKRRYGRIISLASVVGITGNAGQTNYSASKAGIIGLTKSVAKELGARNVTVNAVAPGYIATDMTDVLSDKAKAAIEAGIPMKRRGTPEDVANTICFLASDDASYITGEVIKIDGGLAM
ncbi:MAG: 3-oxoacyl-[acyl-carrier-protein] reductase [Oscillospiraceae bacterium]|nr:3-oxoacyl-[acyl-carrier-protein] reductase [Oscillospiraceae bacterium]